MTQSSAGTPSGLSDVVVVGASSKQNKYQSLLKTI